MTELFTSKYIKLIKLARELNENVIYRSDLYFHPQEGGNEIIVKLIDLNLTNPLCRFTSRPQGNKWEERWVEAYLINKAKNNGWKPDLAGKKYRFLASQFTFRKDPDSPGTRHVDLLLYDEEKGDLVILELKKEANKLFEARKQLEIYINKIRRLYKKEEKAFREVFGLGAIEGVIGYIVYPRNENVTIEEKDFPKYEPFGLMEYIKPWGNNFDRVRKSGKDMEINLTCRKPGKTIEVRH